jgi:hypothetical protein
VLFFDTYEPRSPNGTTFWRAYGPLLANGQRTATLELRTEAASVELPLGSSIPAKELKIAAFTGLLGSYDKATALLRLDPANGATRLQRPLYPHITATTQGNCKAVPVQSNGATPTHWDVRVTGTEPCDVEVTVKLVLSGSVHGALPSDTDGLKVEEAKESKATSREQPPGNITAHHL